MMKQKIAYLDYSPHFAGAERALYTIISHLDRERFEPIIVFPFPYEHHHRYDDLQCEKIYLCDGLKWWMGSDRWRRPLKGTDFIKRSVFGYRLAKELSKRRITILHVNLLRPDCLMWIWFCKRKGIKVIGHFRSLSMEWIPSAKVQERCDVIISVSNIVRDHAMSVYMHPNHKVIYDSISLINKKPQESSKRIISSVAALSPHKGHDSAIMAFDKIAGKYPEYELFIVGGGFEQQYELVRLKSIAEDSKYANRIKFTGDQVPNVEDYYIHSKLVLSLTKGGEAFGLVPFEAALYGTPTIAPNTGAIIELLEDGVSGLLVDTHNVDAIAERMDWALSHYEKCLEINTRTQDIIKRRLTPMIMDEQIMSVYQSCLNKKK